MWNKIRPMLPHAAILFANAYVVFFLIDRVNTAMNFIDNGLTKGLLLAMCLLTIVNWRVYKSRGSRAKKKSVETKAAGRPAAKAYKVRRDGA